MTVRLKGWVSIEQLVMVAGTVHVFTGFVVLIGHVPKSLPIMGPHWCIDNYRPFNYLSEFAENWLKCVFICQVDT